MCGLSSSSLFPDKLIFFKQVRFLKRFTSIFASIWFDRSISSRLVSFEKVPGSTEHIWYLSQLVFADTSSLEIGLLNFNRFLQLLFNESSSKNSKEFSIRSRRQKAFKHSVLKHWILFSGPSCKIFLTKPNLIKIIQTFSHGGLKRKFTTSELFSKKYEA